MATQHRHKVVFVKHDHAPNPERVAADQAVRRSSAAGPHRNKRHVTKGGRSGAKRTAIREGA